MEKPWELSEEKIVQAIQFKGSIPRYAFSMALGKLTNNAFFNSFSNIQLENLPPPSFPNGEWVEVIPYYGGICGSDMGLILLHDSPYTSPFVSFPFVIGHENCGTISRVGSEVKNLKEGMRVVVDPLLPCRTRGIKNICPACQAGNESRCINFSRGNISPGLMTGTCRDTGGSWSEAFVAHESQVITLPDEISFEQGALLDSFASALHPAARNFPRKETDRVLIIGSGPVGICLVYALRALDYQGEITILAKYDFQARAARLAGADTVIFSGPDTPQQVADHFGLEMLKPLMGKNIPLGGVDLVFDCVGNSRSIKDGLYWTAPGGDLVLVGLASFPKGVDWTPIWLKELNVRGIFAYSSEKFMGKQLSTYQLALNLICDQGIDLSPLLTHTFSLNEYEEAIRANLNKKENGIIKSAFKI